MNQIFRNIPYILYLLTISKKYSFNLKNKTELNSASQQKPMKNLSKPYNPSKNYIISNTVYPKLITKTKYNTYKFV